ncbi:nuclear transport factor 2 family protein [Maribacter sp. 2-571]|uniref:nuclear transport factor 2 family protein n=1 Tax=Maribacter sp. 2-571 TaxID=3417569 RepID=UPI003D33B505
MKHIISFLSGIFLMAIGSVDAQVARDSELYQTLMQQDSILFEAAFDTCDVATLEGIFTEDFEFYHDKGGLSEGRAMFLGPMRENCEKRDASKPQASKRILITNSLEVYPLYKKDVLYGAIQHGVHRFESLDENNTYVKGDIAKFTHVWIKEDNIWKVKRELSYDHQYRPQQ